MSMYNLVFGDTSERGTALLAVLGFTSFDQVGRYRDAWLENHPEGGLLIAVYTRNGGGNRTECWESINSAECTCPACVANIALPQHPHWVRGADDTFDSTYRTEYFRVPAEFVDVLAPHAGEHVDTSARWQAAIDAL